MEKAETARDAVAEAWASLDGKLGKYEAGKMDGVDQHGFYCGYQSDAAELIKRVGMRGYVLAPLTVELIGSDDGKE